MSRSLARILRVKQFMANMEEALKRSVKCIREVLEFLDKVKDKKLSKEKDDLVATLRAFLTNTSGLIPSDNSDFQEDEYVDLAKPPDSTGDNSSVGKESLTASENSYSSSKIAPIPCEQLRDAVIADFLELKRKSLMAGAWTKRWCVLHGNILYMYEKSKDKKQKETIDITGYQVTITNEITKEVKRKNHCFELKNSQTNKVYEFCAIDEASVYMWKQRIEKASSSGNHNMPSTSMDSLYVDTKAPNSASQSNNDDLYVDTEVPTAGIHAKADGNDVYVDTEAPEPGNRPKAACNDLYCDTQVEGDTYEDTAVSNHTDLMEETYTDVETQALPGPKLPFRPTSMVRSTRSLPTPPSAAPTVRHLSLHRPPPEPIPFSIDPESPPPSERPSSTKGTDQSSLPLPPPPPPPTIDVGRTPTSFPQSPTSLLFPDKGAAPSLPERPTTTPEVLLDTKGGDIAAPIPCEQLRDAVIADFLELKRKSLMTGAWTKRWCVLHGNILYMYEKSKDKKQKEALSVLGYTISVTNEITKETKRKDRCFELKNTETDKVYEFCANDEESLRKWIQCLQKACTTESNTDDVYEDTQVNSFETVSNQAPMYDDTKEVAAASNRQRIANKVDETEETYDEVIHESPSGPKLPPRPTGSVGPTGSLPTSSSTTSIVCHLLPHNRPLYPEPIPCSVGPESPPPFERPSLTKGLDQSNLPLPPYPGKDVEWESGSGSFTKSSALLSTPNKDILPPPPDSLTTPNSGFSEDSIDVEKDEAKYKDVDSADLYQAMWDCKADEENELSFRRGQLVHIISKIYDSHGWWVAKRGTDVGLVPKEYLTKAYE